MEESFREDFLVKIYTFSAEKQILISIYDDLLVNFASDAKLIGNNYLGSITDLFLAKPPITVIKLKDKEVDRIVLDRPIIKIGRTPDNDICIDNLAVSRVHAILEDNKGTFYVKDCDSLNGTLLNGQKVGRAKLEHRDVLRIGKHDIVFLKQEGRTVTADLYNEGLDQTIMISGGAKPAEAHSSTLVPDVPAAHGGDHLHPRLLEKTPDGDRVIELLKPALIFGTDASADVSINGFLVAAHHAEIVRQGDHYVIRHLKGFRKVKVGGKSVSESILKPNDTIEIANREFTFLE
jgi:pSer/pThr/pTyr-binding forkhead associated (FHA) protein